MSRGQVLIEILIAFSVLTIIIGAISQLLIIPLVYSLNQEKTLSAEAHLNEQIEAVRSIREEGWSNLTNGTFYATPSASKWRLVSTVEGENDSGFKKKIEISNAYRDITGKLTESGGILDKSTKKITGNVSFDNPVSVSFSRVTYLTRYLENNLWTQTTYSDFDAGIKEYVIITNKEGGEVQLDGGCKPGDIPQPNIYSEGLLNGWQEGMWQRKARLTERVTQPPGYVHDGRYSFSIEYLENSDGLSSLTNKKHVCTRGFKNLKFWVYNPAETAKIIRLGGHIQFWTVELTISPKVWQEVIIPYVDLSKSNQDDLFFIYFFQVSDNPFVLYFDQMELIEGIGGYFSLGTLTSSVFDAGTTSSFNRLSFTADKPENTDIGFQLAVSDNINGPWNFLGPKGTNDLGDLHKNNSGEGIFFGENVGRYARYKAFFRTSDGKNTPVLYDMTVNYSP